MQGRLQAWNDILGCGMTKLVDYFLLDNWDFLVYTDFIDSTGDNGVVLIILIVVLLILSIVSLFIGTVDISLFDIFSLSETQWAVMFAGRVPRLVSILVVGMSMSIAGLIMQVLTRNKFVSPTTAGTMDGARLGVLLSLIFFGAAGMFFRTIFAFVFTLAATVLFIKLINQIRFKNIIYVPLVGIMYGNILASITMFIAFQNDMVQNVNTWLVGDFSSILRGRYEMLYVLIPLMIIAYLYANKFIIAGMGEDFSKNLGLNYKLTLNLGLVIVSIISAVTLLIVGVIPFLGLIVPNIISIIFGDNLRKTLPITAVGGALFLLICDIISRTIMWPHEVPISLTVGIIGGAVFLYLLARRRV